MGEIWMWVAFLLFGFVMFAAGRLSVVYLHDQAREALAAAHDEKRKAKEFEAKGFEVFAEANRTAKRATDILQQAQKLTGGG